MKKSASNPNIDWKKKSGFDEDEKVSLNVNIKEAEKYEVKKKSVLKSARKKNNLEQTIGLKKIRKKIKDVFDEDEEDENEYMLSIEDIDRSNSLLNALNDEERRFLKQKESIDTTNHLQNAGKMGTVLVADKMAKEAGIKGIDKERAAEEMQNAASPGKENLQNSLKKDIAKKMDLKWNNLSDREMIGLLRGIKRIKHFGGEDAVRGMTVKDVVEVGDKKIDEKKIAEKILEKSGRDKKARQKEIDRKKFEYSKNKMEKDISKIEKTR